MPEDGSHSSSDYGGYNSAQQRGFPEWLATVRAIAFYVTTFAFATPLFTLMLVIYPLVLAFDKHRRRAEHFINNIWAKLTTLFYYPIKFEGLDNLPAANQPAVYVANHLSFLDIYTLFHLNRDFKFISKTSNFLIPVIGWSMFLTGHVMINRVDRKSQIECLKQCGELLKRGASVLFFPEGTRSKDGKMQPFKKGAFSVAAKAKVPVVPITLVGTGDLMPNNREYLLFPGKVKVVVHPAVQPASADVMMNQAAAAIASSLPLHLRLAEETAAATAGSNGAALPPPATAAAATAAASEAGLTPAAWEDGKQPEAAPAVAASDKE
ncbi:hypothetical protein N2152v2_006947 [Parachlorella kessleri]